MAPAKTGKGAVAEKKTKKEKVYHPESRKAGQINRKAMRRGKLGGLSSNRTKKNIAMGESLKHLVPYPWLTLIPADIYGFFYHSMPEDHVMTLDELHRLIRDIWLTRHDEELAAEISARRKGRPKSTREMKLEELQLREQEVYKAGMGAQIYIYLI